jgi:hypothetical protein
VTLFVRKPEEIDAVQVKRTEQRGLIFGEVKTWIADAIKSGEIERTEDGNHFYIGYKPDGELAAEGDWVVRDEDGDIFKYTTEDLDAVYVRKGFGF